MTPNCSCLLCSKEFYVKPFALTRGRGKFCSKGCQYFYKRNRIEKYCGVCGNKFQIKASENHKMIRCSKECKEKFRSLNCVQKVKRGIAKGEKHWNWRGGVTPLIEKIRRSKKYSKFRKLIFDRDDYTCKICGLRGGYIQVDHIKPMSLFPELTFEESNVRTLCLKCHKNTLTYGYKLMHIIKKYGITKSREWFEKL